MEEEVGELEEMPADFGEGLTRLLSAIYANINSYIISPTLAHHIITTGSRFMFLHKTEPLLVAQIEDYLHGKILVSDLKEQKLGRRQYNGQIRKCMTLFLDLMYWSIFAIMNLLKNTMSKTFQAILLTLYCDFKKIMLGTITVE